MTLLKLEKKKLENTSKIAIKGMKLIFKTRNSGKKKGRKTSVLFLRHRRFPSLTADLKIS